MPIIQKIKMKVTIFSFKILSPIMIIYVKVIFTIFKFINIVVFSKSCLIDAMFPRRKRLTHKKHTLC